MNNIFEKNLTTRKVEIELYIKYIFQILDNKGAGKQIPFLQDDTLNTYLTLIQDIINEMDVPTKKRVYNSFKKVHDISLLGLELIENMDSENVFNEIFDFVQVKQFKGGAIIIEFDNYDYPLPFVKFYGKAESEYKILQGQEYIKEFGVEVGWFQSKIDWSFLFEDLRSLKWLDDEFGLPELEYALLEWLKINVFLFYAQIVSQYFPKANQNLGMTNLHIYISEHDIEPYSIYTL